MSIYGPKYIGNVERDVSGLKYCHRTVSRHGRIAYYFWRRPGPKIRLPDSVGTKEFMKAYYAAYGGEYTVYVPPKLMRPSSHQMARQTIELAVGKARQRAARKKRDFDLDISWGLALLESQNYKCALTGIEFYSDDGSAYRLNPYAPSLDRIDPKQGYTKINTRIIILAMNLMLNDFGIAVFEQVANNYRAQKRKNR